jgi:hypothetical protein
MNVPAPPRTFRSSGLATAATTRTSFRILLGRSSKPNELNHEDNKPDEHELAEEAFCFRETSEVHQSRNNEHHGYEPNHDLRHNIYPQKCCVAAEMEQ